MANASGIPQGVLYSARQAASPSPAGKASRNRSAEQQYSSNSGNPYNYQRGTGMNYAQFLNGQDPSLGRYVPSTLNTTSPTSPSWNNSMGGYGYNAPTQFGGFGGFSQFSQPPARSLQGNNDRLSMALRTQPSIPGAESKPALQTAVDPGARLTPANGAVSYDALLNLLQRGRNYGGVITPTGPRTV